MWVQVEWRVEVQAEVASGRPQCQLKTTIQIEDSKKPMQVKFETQEGCEPDTVATSLIAMSTELRIIEIEQKLYELARHATTVAITQNIGPNSKLESMQN